jgi:hypothetical protein
MLSGSKTGGRGTCWGPVLPKPAVVGVVVPLPACRLSVVHQHLVLLAHHAVEKLHAQAGRLAGPAAESRQSAHEVPVFTPFHQAARLSSPCGRGRVRDGFKSVVNLPAHPQIARFHTDDTFRPVQGQRGTQAVGQCDVALGIDGAVGHAPAALPEGVCKVAHGRQEQHRARLVRPDMGGLLPCFYHQHDVPGAIQGVESRGVLVELVAQDQDQVAAGSGGHGRDCPQTGLSSMPGGAIRSMFGRLMLPAFLLLVCSRGRPGSSISPRPSFSPSFCASSSRGRRPGRPCAAAMTCCL